jgi:hypothetical protein
LDVRVTSKLAPVGSTAKLVNTCSDLAPDKRNDPDVFLADTVERTMQAVVVQRRRDEHRGRNGGRKRKDLNGIVRSPYFVLYQ